MLEISVSWAASLLSDHAVPLSFPDHLADG